MRLKPASSAQVDALNNAMILLRSARRELALADCPRSLARLRGTIKSAEGAERHMRRRIRP